MHVFSEKLFVVHPFAHRLYLIMVGLVLLGIVAEGVLIGPSLFAAIHWGEAFMEIWVLPVVARLSHQPGRIISLNVMLSVLALIQVTSGALGRRTPVLAALHPTTSLLRSGLTVLLLLLKPQLH